MKNEDSSHLYPKTSRRDFLKGGALCIGLLLSGKLGESLLMAADTQKKKKACFKIIKGNRCKRCKKTLERMLKDKKFCGEFSKCFDENENVCVTYGSRAKLSDSNTNIAFGRCAKKLDADIVIGRGCPPKKSQLLKAVKKYAKENSD